MFEKRIQMLRKQAGLSQKELAEKLFISQQSVGKWETGRTKPSPDMYRRIADTFGVSVDYLMGADVTRPAVDKIVIPVLGSVPAGIPIEAVEDVIDYEEAPASWGNGGREYFALKVSGDSMYPRYLDGDTVIIQKSSSCTTGDDCCVYINGFDATLKTVKLHQDGGLTIQPLNPQYAPRTFTPEEIRDLPVSIAGIVVELRRSMRR